MSLGLAAALAVCARARAEDEVPLDRYQPSFAGDAMFAAPDAAVHDGWPVRGRIDVSYAREPLVFVRRSAKGARDVLRVVSHQAVAHYLVSLSLFRRLAFDLDLPVTLSQSGDSGVPALGLRNPSGAALGDLRLGARFELLRQSGFVPAAAMTGAIFAPTGAGGDFTGSSRPRYAIGVAVGADYEHLLWRGYVTRQRNQDGSSELRALLGSGLTFGAGVAWKQGPWQVGPELLGARALQDSRANDPPLKTNLELLLGAKFRFSAFTFGCAGGPGLTRAAGTPIYRLLGSIAFAPEVPAREGDHDSRSSSEREQRLGPSADGDERRADPLAARDRDGDGVMDSADTCPDLAGEASRHGCPKDTDGDAIFDVDDRCPLVSGVPSADSERYGCPPDSDGDGISDPEDACVGERGPARSDSRTNGCPEAVRVQGSQIVLLQQVTFATGSDVLEPESFAVLSQVASVLSEHAEIARLAVDGHTDDVGSEAKNLALSRRRALSVARWLIAHGVDERRLEARGFGPRQPLRAEKTAEARAENRRVEFVIVKRTTLGNAGWKDGAAE